jgi:hypothetical protein
MRFPDNKHERKQIWWAGKELAMDQKLSDYIGVNDKTKVTTLHPQCKNDCFIYLLSFFIFFVIYADCRQANSSS